MSQMAGTVTPGIARMLRSSPVPRLPTPMKAIRAGFGLGVLPECRRGDQRRRERGSEEVATVMRVPGHHLYLSLIVQGARGTVSFPQHDGGGRSQFMLVTIVASGSNGRVRP